MNEEDKWHVKYSRADFFARAAVRRSPSWNAELNETTIKLVEAAFIAGWNSAEEYAANKKEETAK
jgi:hypothetical protein